MISLPKIEAYMQSMRRYLWNPSRWVREVCRFEIDPWQESYLNTLVHTGRVAVAGCNGCLSANTPIFNVESGENVPVAEIGRDFIVYSYDDGEIVETVAHKPFQKGHADIYRVMLSTGESFECTLEHKILTPSGWHEVGSLMVGSACVVAPRLELRSDSSSSWSHRNACGQSTQEPYGRHCLKIVQDSLACYLHESRSYDERLHSGQGIALSEIPLLVDALLHSQHGYIAGGGSFLQEHNHPYQQFGHLSKSYFSQDSLQSLAYGEYLSGAFSSGFPKTVSPTLRQSTQYPLGGVPRENQHIADHAQRPSCGVRDCSCLNHTLSIATIQSIDYIKNDIFYDLHVPGTNNYWANGAFHHNSGKDFISSAAALFLLSLRPLLKGQVTGPNKEQIFDVSWAEKRKIIDNAPILQSLLIWEKTHIRNRLAPEQWFLAAKTASKKFSKAGGEAQAEGIQGLRGRYTYVDINEASGVEDPNFEAALSCCATPNSFLSVEGNALRRSGFFYDLFHSSNYREWPSFHVSYLNSSFTDKAQHEQWIREYGLESAFCMARCLGEFPTIDADDVAIQWGIVRAAMDRVAPLRDSEFLQIGVDPARGGSDEAVITVRTGYVVQPQIIFKTCTGPELCRAIYKAVFDYGGNEETLILIDESGMGGLGVVDPLLDKPYNMVNVVGVQNIQAPRRRDRYRNWDDEVWMEACPDFLQYGCLPFDELLLKQLTTRKCRFTGKTNAQRQLESKDTYKARMRMSPDRAESLLLAIADDPRTIPPLEIMKLDGHEQKDEAAVHAEAVASMQGSIEQEGVYWP